MNYRVTHRTTYWYNEPVSTSYHALRLTPRTLSHQNCRWSNLAMDPSPAFSSDRVDYFGNVLALVTVQEPHQQLAVEASSEVEVMARTWPEAGETPAWEQACCLLADDLDPEKLDAFQFTFESAQVRCLPQFAEYARTSFMPGTPLLAAALDLTARVHRDFTYDPSATEVTTPVERVFQERRGVCQDFAHFQIACLRSLGLAARYVSGYLQTFAPPDRQRLIGADASHAWVSLYCPGLGWIDLDPTNNLAPSTSYITLAWGRDYNDVSPIRGVIQGGGQHELTVSVDVTSV
ncbi:MAG: transglutaminase family protein [Acidobacteriota bacterium]